MEEVESSLASTNEALDNAVAEGSAAEARARAAEDALAKAAACRSRATLRYDHTILLQHTTTLYCTRERRCLQVSS